MKAEQPHRLTFELGDEGNTGRWKVAECPGPEHCKVYLETDCRCGGTCGACAEYDHWECAEYRDQNVSGLGAGCSLKLSETCGLADWLDEVGGGMVGGSVELSVLAVHNWDDVDYPQFEFVAS